MPFKLFYDAERNIPVGLVIFARICYVVAARLDAGGRLASLDDWRSGTTMRAALSEENRLVSEA